MAFPAVATLRDDFNRPNEGPPPSPNWLSPGVGLIVASNQAKTIAPSADATIWGAYKFGPDCELYFAVPFYQPSSFVVFLRLRELNTSGDGYRLNIDPPNWKLYRLGATVTQLGATATQAITSGDTIGFEATGSTIKAHHKPSAGSWAEVMSRTDDTFPEAGYVALGVQEIEPLLDDFHAGPQSPEAPMANQPVRWSSKRGVV